MAESIIRRIVDVDTVAANENMTAFVNDNGAIKQVPIGEVGGSKMPEPAGANMQLVTDGNGEKKWEERLAYGLPEQVVTVLEETTIEYGAGHWVNRDVSGIELVEGAEYTVMWNGTAYVTICAYYTDGPFGVWRIGNPDFEYPESNNGMPFRIEVFSSGGCDIARVDTTNAETVTISITGRVRNYKKIDAELLPTLNNDDSTHKGIVSPEEIVKNSTGICFLNIGATSALEVFNALKPMGNMIHSDIYYRVLVDQVQGWGDGSFVIRAVCAEYGLVYLKLWFDDDTMILEKIQIEPCGYTPIAMDANGNYWKIKVSTDGALSTELYEIPTYDSENPSEPV